MQLTSIKLAHPLLLRRHHIRLYTFDFNTHLKPCPEPRIAPANLQTVWPTSNYQENRLTMVDNGEDIDFKLYRYDPSMAAAVIFIILFFLVSTLHLYQMVRTRTWIFIPFVLGGFCKSSNSSANRDASADSTARIVQFVGYIAVGTSRKVFLVEADAQ